jgi:hypothetical protein
VSNTVACYKCVYLYYVLVSQIDGNCRRIVKSLFWQCKFLAIFPFP